MTNGKILYEMLRSEANEAERQAVESALKSEFPESKIAVDIVSAYSNDDLLEPQQVYEVAEAARLAYESGWTVKKQGKGLLVTRPGDQRRRLIVTVNPRTTLLRWLYQETRVMA